MIHKVTNFLKKHTDNMKILSIDDLRMENFRECSKFDSIMFVDGKSKMLSPDETIHINSDIYCLTFYAEIKLSTVENRFVIKYAQRWFSTETFVQVENGNILDGIAEGMRYGQILIYEKIGFCKELTRFANTAGSVKAGDS